MSDATPLVLHAPARRAPELSWVAEMLLGRFLGLPWRLQLHDAGEVRLQAPGGEVVWPDVFLAGADGQWRHPSTLPALPFADWPLPDATLRERLGQSTLPVLFGDGRFETGPGRVRLPIDVTGTCFFLLSRYEEGVAGASLDAHGRFGARASLPHRAGLGLRPLVDELVELLWWALAPMAPSLRRLERRPSLWVSCDVDAPYSAGGRSWGGALRQAGSALLNERSPRLAGQALLHATAARLGTQRFDPYDTFDWMLEANERAGHRMSFFFLSVRQPRPIDGGYELDEPRIAALLRRIADRGHAIGLHGSYRSIDEPERLAGELDGLRRAVVRARGDLAAVGSRQHYLRWRTPGTARLLDGLGLAYDSTLGFADGPGFRCGTCHPFPLFDLDARRGLSLIERPLVLMEATVLSKHYMGLGHGQRALDLMLGLKAACARFGGEFSLLWHNSNFGHPAARAMYLRLIEPLA